MDEIKQDVFDAFRYVEDKSHIKIYNINLDADHIHLLLSFPPDYSLSQTVNKLKQMTTNYKNLIDMTVQELIDSLCKIDDKSMQVVQDNFEEIYNIEVIQGIVVLRSW